MNAIEKTPFFYEVRTGLTINLADVKLVRDETGYDKKYPELPAYQEHASSGRTWRVVAFSSVQVTPEEGRKLQDALNWYNRQLWRATSAQ